MSRGAAEPHLAGGATARGAADAQPLPVPHGYTSAGDAPAALAYAEPAVGAESAPWRLEF
jgi:hypothetical protein